MRVIHLPVIVLLALLIGCNGDCRRNREQTFGPTLTVSELFLTGPSVVRVGDLVQYHLRARFADGTEVDVSDDATFLHPDEWGRQFVCCNTDGSLAFRPDRTGTAMISAEYGGASVRLDVIVLAENELIRTNVAALAFEHVIRMSPCPQVIDGLEVTNPGLEHVTLTLASTHPALRVTAEPYTLAPGATVRVPVAFDCSTTASFAGTVTVTAAGQSGQMQTQSVPVTATIRS